MEKMIANGDFLETTEFSSNLYGTRLIKKIKYSFNKNICFCI
jgi:guanylate kinase